MSKDEEYRGLAASCLQLAKASRRLDQKARLLAMAEAWLNLAERASGLAMHHARRVAEHPPGPQDFRPFQWSRSRIVLLPALTVGMRAHAGEAILDAGITRSDQRTRTARGATDGIAAARPPLLGTLRHVHKALGLIAGESGHRRQVVSGQAQKTNP
jgi:hypothetical protein